MWKQVLSEGDEKYGSHWIEIKSDGTVVEELTGEGQSKRTGTFTLNLSKKTKRIDLVFKMDGGSSELKMIYELKGDQPNLAPFSTTKGMPKLRPSFPTKVSVWRTTNESKSSWCRGFTKK